MTSKTVISSVHEYDLASGFCKKCGNHAEAIKLDDLLCMYADNSVAISHIRWHMIRDQKAAALREKFQAIAQALRKQRDQPPVQPA